MIRDAIRPKIASRTALASSNSAGAADADAANATDSASTRAAIDRYVAAFERADVAALVQLLTDDVVLEMPPVLNWYVGRDHYAKLMTHRCPAPGRSVPGAPSPPPASGRACRSSDASPRCERLPPERG